jgi:hypothetical protein
MGLKGYSLAATEENGHYQGMWEPDFDAVHKSIAGALKDIHGCVDGEDGKRTFKSAR